MKEDIQKVQKRKVEDIIEFGNRKFRMRMFDPLEGNYILTQLLSFALPFAPNMFSGFNEYGTEVKRNNEEAQQTPQQKPMMPKREFIELQKDILSYCFEMLPSGDVPVIRDNGTYGVKVDQGIVMQLIMACIAYNFTNFFGGNASQGESIDQ